MDCPKISIITITYNSENTIRDTLESVRRQQYSNLEYLIVDGGSKDQTLSILEEYRDIITSVVSEPDEGISDAMNKGIQRATGDVIGIIHSDDMLVDGALATLAQNWDENYDVFYGHSIVCAEDGTHMHQLCAQQDLSGLKYGLCLVHPSTFVTKTAYQKYGVFDKNYRCSMDYELLLRFYTNGAKFKYIDQSLAIYRIGGTNMQFRKHTIDEVCKVSIRYGGNPFKANFIKMKKKAVDLIRHLPITKHIKNGRVKKL